MEIGFIRMETIQVKFFDVYLLLINNAVCMSTECALRENLLYGRSWSIDNKLVALIYSQ